MFAGIYTTIIIIINAYMYFVLPNKLNVISIAIQIVMIHLVLIQQARLFIIFKLI